MLVIIIVRVCSVVQSCLIIWNPVDHSPPGSSAHGILQARILEWVAISSSRGSSQPRDQTQVYWVSCTAGISFTTEPLGDHHLINIIIIDISETQFSHLQTWVGVGFRLENIWSILGKVAIKSNALYLGAKLIEQLLKLGVFPWVRLQSWRSNIWFSALFWKSRAVNFDEVSI